MIVLTDNLAVYNNIIQPFSWEIWTLLLVAMATFCLVVSGIAGFYQRFFPDENHIVPSVRASDIIIGTIASMTEPDGMMWFPRFNAGETVVSVCTFVWLMKWYLTCRSPPHHHLAHFHHVYDVLLLDPVAAHELLVTTPTVEKPIDTAADRSRCALVALLEEEVLHHSQGRHPSTSVKGEKLGTWHALEGTTLPDSGDLHNAYRGIRKLVGMK